MYCVIISLVEDCIFRDLRNNSGEIAVRAGNVRVTVHTIVGSELNICQLKTGTSVGSATRLVQTKTIIILR